MDGSGIEISSNYLEKRRPPNGKYTQHQDDTRNVSRSTYHYRAIELKLEQRPWLESLNQFMDPTAQGFAMNHAKRMKHFDIKVIHFPKTGKPDSAIICPTPGQFEEAVSGDAERTGTLVLAKGLSRAMIEVLGTRFELEPELFASHLAGTELYRMGHAEPRSLRAPARAPILLSDYITKAPFYAIEYRRPYQIEGGRERAFKLRVTETSTPRGIHIIHDNLHDHFASEKISVYKRKGSNIGIILTDELLSDVPPASYILNPVTWLDEDTENLSTEGRQRQVSARRELISWLQHLTPKEVNALFNDDEQLALRPVLKIGESNSVMFLAYARHFLNRIFAHRCDAQFPDSIPFFLHLSRALLRQIRDQKSLLHNTLRVASLRGGDDIVEQKQAFDFLASEMEGVLTALGEDVNFLVGEASIREGKIVGWVSKFAALFLPVSLLATILSISDPGYVRWAILGGLSVPFVLISIYFIFFWKPAHLSSFKC